MQSRDAIEPRDDDTGVGLGASPRLPLTGFIVFGLITFWVYTAIRMGTVLREHLAERWSEIRPSLEAAGIPGDRLEAITRQGYPRGIAIPNAAAALFAIDGLVVIWWFWNWIIVGDASEYTTIMAVVGFSSVLFYAATCLLVVWTARRLYHHETVELLIKERGPSAARRQLAPAAAIVARWEQHNNRIALFLIVALPIVASPAVGAHLFLTGASGEYAGWPAALCFVFAAAFHYWGTKLLVGLFNTHLETEAAQRGAAVPAVAAVQAVSAAPVQVPTGADGLEPYDGAEPFIFVSYKREDFPRIRPVLRRIRDSGYRLWYDKAIPGGAEWDALIEQKVKGCSMLLFFVSRGSVESKYCRREVKYVDQLGKPILSVKLEPVELVHGLEMLLTQYQMVDTANQDFSGEIERSLKYLRLL